MELLNSTVLVTGATGNVGPYVVDHPVNDGATVIGTSVSNTGRTDVEERPGQLGQMTGGQLEVAA